MWLLKNSSQGLRQQVFSFIEEIQIEHCCVLGTILNAACVLIHVTLSLLR